MKKNLLKSHSNASWIITLVIVPVLCSIISAIVIIKVTERPTIFVYREIPILEKFDSLSYFPLKKGNYWIYSCKYKRAAVPDNKKSSGPYIKTGIINIKMIIENVFVSDNYSLIILKGNPRAGNEGINDRFGLLLVSNKIYEVDESPTTMYDILMTNDKETLLKRLDDKRNLLDKLIDATKKKELLPYRYYEMIPLILEFPLYDGQKFGDLLSLSRHDLSYLSLVERIDAYSVRNNNKLETRSVFKITQSTIPADLIITFIPYIGITNVTYQHHGTIDEFEAKLVDYYIKEDK